jgi:hypothetical protein
VKWPEIRAGLVAAAIGLGLVDGCPVVDRPPPWAEGITSVIAPIRRVVLWPVSWVRPTLRISQQWTLFQAAPVEANRMSIEGLDASGTWRVLFRAGDPEHDEDADLLFYRRVRDAWDPSDGPAEQYFAFASWVTARALARHADITAARVQFERVLLDGGDVVGTGQFVHAFTRSR